MVTIYVEQITKTCYSFKPPREVPFFVYEANFRRAKKSFIKSFGLRGATCIKFEKVKK